MDSVARLGVLSAALLAAACGSAELAPDLGRAPEAGGGEAVASWEIAWGVGIGPVKLGMTFPQVTAAIGERDSKLAFNRLIAAKHDRLGLEILYASAADYDLSDDAVVVSVAADGAHPTTGQVVPGSAREQVTRALGDPSEVVGPLEFFPQGIGISYDEASRASRVAVFASCQLAPVPPEMSPAE